MAARNPEAFGNSITNIKDNKFLKQLVAAQKTFMLNYKAFDYKKKKRLISKMSGLAMPSR